MKTIGIAIGIRAVYGGILALLAWLAPVWAAIVFAIVAAPGFMRAPMLNKYWDRRPGQNIDIWRYGG